MIYKQKHIALLSGLFIFTVTNPAQYSSSDEMKKQSIKQGSIVLGTQLNDAINQCKENNGYIPKITQSQLDLNTSQQGLTSKQMELNEQQKILNDKQAVLTDKQIEESILNQHLSRIAMTKETCALLPHNDKEAGNMVKRLKLKMIEFNKDLPELPTEETPEIKQPEPSTTTTPEVKPESKPKNDGLLSAIGVACMAAATNTGKFTDTITDYSFGYVTKLECLKGSFIDKHATGINRTLVAATAAVITYAAYSLYKTKKQTDDDDDDIFNDDNDH